MEGKVNIAVHYSGKKKIFKARKTSTILDSIKQNKIPIGNSCGGEGVCTTCRILVHKGEVTVPEGIEQEQIEKRGFGPRERLSCQCRPQDDVTVEIP